MHDSRLSRDWLEEQRARRGRGGLALVPAQTALLVIDMQNVFTEPGAPLEVPRARGIVDNINTLADALRAAGGTVIWVFTTLAEQGGARDWNYLRDFLKPERREAVRAALRPGHRLHAFWPGLRIDDADTTCEKDRFSPFSPGASRLDALLKEAGIAHLLVAGTLTNVCCECTARDAMMLNYRVTVVEDANAAQSDEDHLLGLTTVAQLFADVRLTDEVVGALQDQTG